MATSVTITGTGFPRPSANRAGPGVLVETDGFHLQFDAGRSTVQRLAAAGVSMQDLDALFVTHHHSDHLVGIPDIVLTRWITARGDNVPQLAILGPGGPLETFFTRMFGAWELDLRVRSHHTGRHPPGLEFTAFDTAHEGVVVWERGTVAVRAFPVCHEPVAPAVGYRVETSDGAIAITGDTRVCEEVVRLADGADVLVYEAMLFEAMEQLPPDSHFVMDYHADSRLIGAQAERLGVDTLVLTHLIPEPDTPGLHAAYVDNVRSGGFTGELIVAEDLDVVVLGSGGATA